MLKKKDYSSRLHSVIPAGAHTYSRGDDQYPENAPQILARGEGCYIWDGNGKKYLDYGMALRAVTVGYAYKPIAEAAYREILNGNNLTRASITELKAAELISKLIPSADMVKFAKNGSNVTTAALKLARAYTGKKYIAACAEHPFFSFDDWFIGTTVMDSGVPEENKMLTLKFNYNNIASLKKIFSEFKNNIAAVILEPATIEHPENNFLQEVKELCVKNKTVLIFDEMITGFRWHLNGAQKYYKVIPDLATFGKGMANGFSVAALTGKREIMELGGINKIGAERVFLISTTHGAEMNGLGAFIKTVEIYKELEVVKHLWTYGKKLIAGINDIAKDLGINDYFYLAGIPCSPNYFTKDRTGNMSLEFRTLFSQEMINNGILMPWIALSYAHKDKELNITLTAARKALKIYSFALENGIKKYLKSRIIKPVFRKHN